MPQMCRSRWRPACAVARLMTCGGASVGTCGVAGGVAVALSRRRRCPPPPCVAQVVADSKVRMTGDVVGQLQHISAQQGRIREMINKLAAYSEVLAGQESSFGQLRCGPGVRGLGGVVVVAARGAALDGPQAPGEFSCRPGSGAGRPAAPVPPPPPGPSYAPFSLPWSAPQAWVACCSPGGMKPPPPPPPKAAALPTPAGTCTGRPSRTSTAWPRSAAGAPGRACTLRRPRAWPSRWGRSGTRRRRGARPSCCTWSASCPASCWAPWA
jgi:hypothetical protein